MTKKDFVTVAKALRELKPETWNEKMGASQSIVVHTKRDQFDRTVNVLCSAFHECNVRFDATRFREFIYGTNHG